MDHKAASEKIKSLSSAKNRTFPPSQWANILITFARPYCLHSTLVAITFIRQTANWTCGRSWGYWVLNFCKNNSKYGWLKSWNLIIWIVPRSSVPPNTHRRGKLWRWVVRSPATYLKFHALNFGPENGCLNWALSGFFHLLQQQRSVLQFASRPLQEHASVPQFASRLLQEQPISPQLHDDRFRNT